MNAALPISQLGSPATSSSMEHNAAVPPGNLENALKHVREGGRLLVLSVFRVMTIDNRMLQRSEKGGTWLLKEAGRGFRLRCGGASLYLVPGQLVALS